MNVCGVPILQHLGGKLCLFGRLVKTVGISSRHFQFETLMFGDTIHGVRRPIRDLKGKRLCVCVFLLRTGLWMSVLVTGNSDIINFVTIYFPPAIFVWWAVYYGRVIWMCGHSVKHWGRVLPYYVFSFILQQFSVLIHDYIHNFKCIRQSRLALSDREMNMCVCLWRSSCADFVIRPYRSTVAVLD